MHSVMILDTSNFTKEALQTDMLPITKQVIQHLFIMLLKQHSHSLSNEFVLCRLFVEKFVVVLTFYFHSIKQMVRINAKFAKL